MKAAHALLICGATLVVAVLCLGHLHQPDASIGGAAAAASSSAAPRGGGIAGIASLYPGDKGIARHSDVIFAEDFEQSTLAELFQRWSNVRNGSSMSFSADVPAGSIGHHSLSIAREDGGSEGGHLFMQLLPGSDTLYVRYYIKYPASHGYNHTGIWMGGYYPPLSWPNPQAGIKPVGNDRFSAAAEQNTLTSGFDHYDYWMDMRRAIDGRYWGNLLLNNPDVRTVSDRWTCVEHMVRLNNPVTSTNGEHAIWLDGTRVSHVGLGFPAGSWHGGVFTQRSDGAPFEGIRWRSDVDLTLNWIWLQNYALGDPVGMAGAVKFDDVVVARAYIGCVRPE